MGGEGGYEPGGVMARAWGSQPYRETRVRVQKACREGQGEDRTKEEEIDSESD